MVHNNTWLALVVWLFSVVSVNADRHEPDRIGDGNRWESTVGDERIISAELAWWYFDTDWDFSGSDNEGNRTANDRRQSNRDRDLFGDFEFCDRELFKLVHHPSFDWYRCNKPCVVVCHSQGCFENRKRSKRFGERIMIDSNLLYIVVGFGAGVVCHRFVMAALEKVFGWMNK
jgi:hypothetical protein